MLSGYLPLLPGDLLPTVRTRDSIKPPARNKKIPTTSGLLEVTLLHISLNVSLIFAESNFILDCDMLVFVA